jgi:hypothetical protein
LWSLYDDGTPPHNWYTGPGVSVSFDRPYARYRQIFDAPLSQGSGEFLLWEFLSVGHDEYWSLDMYRNVRHAIDSGVHAAFFSGNSVDGVIDIRASGAGAAARTIERIGKFGGANSEREKKFEQQWKKHGPDPARLMGAGTTNPANGTADWTCVNEKHWLFENSGMHNGDSIKGLVGWEHHGPPLATIPNLEVLARGPVSSGGQPRNVEYTATIYPGPKNNWVFNAATIWWSDGLSEPPSYLRPAAHGGKPPGPDTRVEQITKNLFNRFLST